MNFAIERRVVTHLCNFAAIFFCYTKNWLVPWRPFPLISRNLIRVFLIDWYVGLADPDRAAVENRILTRMQGSTFAPSIVAYALRNLASWCYLCAIPLLRGNRVFPNTRLQVNWIARVSITKIVDMRINLVETGEKR